MAAGAALSHRIARRPFGRATGGGVRAGAVAELARREATAFDALFELYAGKLLGYAQRSLPRSDAEDVVQETFLVVVQKAQTLVEHPNLGGFLFQTLRFLIVDRLRRQERQHVVDLNVETQRWDEHADEVATAAIRQEALERVAQRVVLCAATRWQFQANLDPEKGESAQVLSRAEAM
jgi:RNA polymerase sigma factor (sigma-70 family)